MRDRDYDPFAATPERGVATIRLADLETRAATSVSWRELQIDRREIPLPPAGDRRVRRPQP